eukprot:COSAG01_NODE_330_length_18723_cov_96.763155_5_plen_201_part_00
MSSTSRLLQVLKEDNVDLGKKLESDYSSIMNLKKNTANSFETNIVPDLPEDNSKVEKQMEILKHPSKQAQILGAENPAKLGFLLFEKIKHLKKKKPFDTSLFCRSFANKVISNNYHTHVIKNAEHHKIKNTMILPPLLVRSNESVILKYGSIYLVCHEFGPVIPLCSAHTLPKQQLLQDLYSKTSYEFLNASNFKIFFSE